MDSPHARRCAILLPIIAASLPLAHNGRKHCATGSRISQQLRRGRERGPRDAEHDLVTGYARSGEPPTASMSRSLRCTSFQLSSEVKRSTPTKNKSVKPTHIASHKFCQESGNSRTVAKVAATIIAKPVDVMKRILRRTRRSRSCGSPLCLLAKTASLSVLPSVS